MIDYSFADLIDAIAGTFDASKSVIKRVQSYDEMTEGMNDYPVLQFFPPSYEMDTLGDTGMTTFRGGVRTNGVSVGGILYAHPRPSQKSGMSQYVLCLDEIRSIVEAQTTRPYFGYSYIKAFSVTVNFAIQEIGGKNFTGADILIQCLLF